MQSKVQTHLKHLLKKLAEKLTEPNDNIDVTGHWTQAVSQGSCDRHESYRLEI